MKIIKMKIVRNKVFHVTWEIEFKDIGQVPNLSGLNSEIQHEVTKLIVAEIMEKRSQEIIAEVLKNVNWPEIVRSEVAQKVIKEVATKSNY